jgi:hypothetical protein
MRNETTGDRPAEVTRVICASISQMEGSVMDELLKIRDRNCVPDAAPPVRGAVLYSRGWFVLWLEGDEAEIDTVMRKAASDPRNAHQKEIHRSGGGAKITSPPQRSRSRSRWSRRKAPKGPARSAAASTTSGASGSRASSRNPRPSGST